MRKYVKQSSLKIVQWLVWDRNKWKKKRKENPWTEISNHSTYTHGGISQTPAQGVIFRAEQGRLVELGRKRSEFREAKGVRIWKVGYWRGGSHKDEEFWKLAQWSPGVFGWMLSCACRVRVHEAGKITTIRPSPIIVKFIIWTTPGTHTQLGDIQPNRVSYFIKWPRHLVDTPQKAMPRGGLT